MIVLDKLQIGISMTYSFYPLDHLLCVLVLYKLDFLFVKEYMYFTTGLHINMRKIMSRFYVKIMFSLEKMELFKWKRC